MALRNSVMRCPTGLRSDVPGAARQRLLIVAFTRSSRHKTYQIKVPEPLRFLRWSAHFSGLAKTRGEATLGWSSSFSLSLSLSLD